MTAYYQDDQVTLHHGDALDVARELPAGAADCIVTSPPYYGLRDYGTEGQYGLEASPAEYVETMRALFAELRRVLAADGTLWLNIGDSYSSGNNASTQTAGSSASSTLTTASKAGAWAPGSTIQSFTKPGAGIPAKNLLGIPWRVAFALQDDGWILRNAIIWHKPNAMPESVTDRLSGRYEHVFMFSKSKRYWFDLDPIREAHDTPQDKWATKWRYGMQGQKSSQSAQALGQKHHGRIDGSPSLPHPNGRNPGDVWTIPTRPFPGAHFAVFPVALPQRCILAGCKPGGTVLDPFNGSGTTGLAAQNTGRKYIGIDLNREYLDLSIQTRLTQSVIDFEAGA